MVMVNQSTTVDSKRTPERPGAIEKRNHPRAACERAGLDVCGDDSRLARCYQQVASIFAFLGLFDAAVYAWLNGLALAQINSHPFCFRMYMLH